MGHVLQVALPLFNLALGHGEQTRQQHGCFVWPHVDDESAPVDELRKWVGGRRDGGVAPVAVDANGEAPVEQAEIEASGETLAVPRRAEAKRGRESDLSGLVRPLHF